ncbi:hypothetical protein A2331_02670 [Candidatus Falkowbacteria bacterium RIFOXYB2_FULL_34_18]|uniref:Glycosyltransferase 2-like domain-containing protein n=1 Tax=Candidatus Falkowbacteria bacterium RIFOXYD2_FULL_34_120 TaxID=1798007 RepID=A0A1F5TRV3_9BACT|nr:MAG: hypothetical protein A2331_02670 [Candidatus Falkowbacteria bacterium RIFOXYB2_FULL_34_18]OGF29644.1 MAG: hypothetical protein A2500_00700 [Candidatus Falkowbacteria bacterium RIFOXYC12_FULL_34_55]OGF37371.1 MAG: hypothetical protein A2466_01470 [Candidatus Falkowbacteria bacterium RIFOXYC2_FULL_34_220]OGF39109.1 MAG: hypothetical protein A2515_00120 [Candidatus Falkowbacteria bacterium RIFOXYD12_FULL_34_57]OGF41633.1 MAG: hypothetical protein A2531_06355 [Candidatus Falkowbacteria bact
MFTIFTIPKSFTNQHINIIQKNAINSWKKLIPQPEIILIGDDPGIAETARELEVKHIPGVQCNKYGTPLLDHAFCLARQNAKYNTLAFINADIITLPNFTNILKHLPQKEYLILGERYDLDQTELIAFNDNDWDKKMWQNLQTRGKKHPPEGSDYFIFDKNSFQNIPSFAVGRVGWDNWMIYHAKKEGIITIDASPVATIIHQNHDYSHHVKGQKDKRDPETQINVKLTRQDGFCFLDETEWLITERGMKKRWFPKKAKIKRKFRGYLKKIKKIL